MACTRRPCDSSRNLLFFVLYNETTVQEIMSAAAAGKKKGKSHGGARLHSGSKTNANRLGPPKDRGTVASHFLTQNKTIGASMMPDEAAHIPHHKNNKNFPEDNETTPPVKPPTWEAEVQATLHVLYKHVKAVFDFFADKLDSTTGKPLFKEKAKERAERVLKMIADGYISDPPGYDFYVRKTDSRGRVMVDKDGLRLYRSLRGTSTLESLRQKLTLCFGHFRAGIKYSDCLLAVVRHIQNWRASERNRPDFPQVRHHDGSALDMMNELYEAIFGYPKYKDWIPFNETAAGLKASPYGIVPLGLKITEMTDIDIKSIQKLPRSLQYLAICQGSNVLYTPVPRSGQFRSANLQKCFSNAS
jgi:hypothetical protein